MGYDLLALNLKGAEISELGRISVDAGGRITAQWDRR
jgi:hypothetical protein